ncbi:hypothetical protein [Methyloglobulus sp.]|uniref:hypothetical protein n=1 Tax=Methyloglobulus sp. TaxID=2518622 RepID=UPI0032B78E26
MELIINQQIYYSNKESVPLREVAESLMALDEVFKQSSSILEALFPGTTIESVEVFFNELQSGSISEDLFVKFVFGSQENLEKFIDNSRKQLKIEELANKPLLLSAIVITLILSAGYYLLDKDKSSNLNHKIAINGNNNTIIQLTANEFDIEPEKYKSIVEDAINKKLTKNAVKVVRPAKLDEDSSIKVGVDKNLEINNASVKAMPSYIQESEEEDIIEDIKGIELEIRAIDLDSKKTGWHVVAPNLHGKRIKMQLDPTINPDELSKKRKFLANVSVLFSLENGIDKIPKLIFLREIITKKSKNKK